MSIRRIIAILATASLAFWAPSIVPVKALTIGCGEVTQYQTIDTAYAGVSTPRPTGKTPSPWPAVVVIVGVVSVIVNAAYIWNTQCRELSSQEAMTSAFLPFLGIALDVQASKCRH